jgi:hypothetical protein
MTPDEARAALTSLRWEPSIDGISYVLTDGTYDYDVAVDRGEMDQAYRELVSMMEAVANTKANVHIVVAGSKLDTMVTGRMETLDWNATEARIVTEVAEWIAVDCALGSEQVQVEIDWNATEDRVSVTSNDQQFNYELHESASNSIAEYLWCDAERWAVWE